MVGGGAFLRDMKPPLRAWIFGEELTAPLLVLPNLTWGKLFLPGDAYPMAKSSWCLGMYIRP
jgi:hypothetical protein